MSQSVIAIQGQAQGNRAIHWSYQKTLEAKVARGFVVGSAQNKTGRLDLIHGRIDGCFTLLLCDGDGNGQTIFDSKVEMRWGRKVLVFGYDRGNGRFSAVGHGVLNGSMFTVRIASGGEFCFKADPSAPYLNGFSEADDAGVPSETKRKKRRKNRGGMPRSDSAMNDGVGNQIPGDDEQQLSDNEEDDLTEDDLARLRGDLPMPEHRRRY
jgi:hypothetical protein